MQESRRQKAHKFAIASCTQFATEAGAQVAELGANAIDIGVAVALDLLVTNPLMCGIGGGGFATVRTANGEFYTVDFFDAMPGKGLPDSFMAHFQYPEIVYLDYGIGVQVAVGHKSVAVPGTMKGLELVLKNFGTLTFKDIVFPAVEHAKKGIPLNDTVAYWLDLSSEKIHWYTEYAKQVLSTDQGKKLSTGDVVRQEDLAKTLEIVAEEGSDVIYKGDIATLITEEILSHGGLVTKEDLASYEAIVRKPTLLQYKNYQIATNPPPSAGGPTLITMLKIAEHLDMQHKYTPEMVVKLGRLIKISLEERYAEYTDASTNYEKFQSLTSETSILRKAAGICRSPDTTHLSVVDDLGNAISITMSLGYGSGVGVQGTGIIFDNVLGEVEMNPLGFYALKPGERFVSNMAPTIMLDSNTGAVTALGTPGASRIPSCLFHVITNLADLGVSLDEAVLMPRFHYEEGKFAVEEMIQTEAIHPQDLIVRFPSINMYFGGAQCAQKNSQNDFHAVSDPRRSGSSKIIRLQNF